MYQVKYFYTFKDINDNQFRVEILEDSTGIITPEEVRAGDNPFTIEYPDSNKFQPVRGSGCSFNLLSDTSMKFIGLSTANMFQYQIKLLEIVQVTPVYTQEVLKWCGYLNSEMYEEPFNEYDNYLVNFTGNDGFALLDRLNYVSESGEHYNSITYHWITLFNIFYKLKLPYNKLYVGLSTTIPNFTISTDKTIFHYIYNNPDNWYNEDNEQESVRTVLETLLSPLGAFIIAVDGNVYITDNNQLLSSGQVEFKVYDLQNDFLFLYTENINSNLGDLSGIGFGSNKQSFSMVSGFNKQIVKYNNYRLTNVINYDANEDSFTEQDLPINYGNSNYGYLQTTFDYSPVWNNYNGSNFISMFGVGQKNQNVNMNGLRLQPKNDGFNISPSHLAFQNQVNLPYILGNSNYKLKLEMKLHPHTWEHLGLVPSDLDSDDAIVKIKLHMEIIVDNEIGTKVKHLNTYTSGNIFNSNHSWVNVTDTTASEYHFALPIKEVTANYSGYGWLTTVEYNNANDRDIELKLWSKGQSVKDEYGNFNAEAIENDFVIPLPTNCSGRVLVKIYDYELEYKDGHTGVTTGFYWNLLLKELKLTVLDQYGNEVKKSDIEFVGDSTNSPLNSQFKNAGEEVVLYNGSNLGSYPVENGNLLKVNSGGYYEPHIQFTRQGVTSLLENLLLRSIVSNYNKQFIQLSLTSNKLEGLVGYLTYNNYLPGKRFIMTGLIRRIAESLDEITIQETTEDNVDITLF